MSSHREAPEISKDPVADSTDLYAFVSPDQPDKVTLIANYLPLQAPAGGPNFYPFGDDVLYEIHIDNDGDARPDITYQFRFTTKLRNRNTFLYNTGPITSLDSHNWNSRQTYSVTRIDGLGHRKALATHLPTPPDNIGPLSTPNYAALAQAAVQSLGGGVKVFAGQRADAFFVDLGSIFDLLTLRPLQQLHAFHVFASGPGVNALNNTNVKSIAIQVPIKDLVRPEANRSNPLDPKNVIGVWTSASRQQVKLRDRHTDNYVATGPFMQVSRLGNPLVNEVIIPLGHKDQWNHDDPADDKQFNDFVLRPEVAALLPDLYPGQFPNLKQLVLSKAPRLDLQAILHTGIPADLIAGFQNFTGTVQADMLRLNTGISPTSQPNALGLLGGDLAGFPNGRRPGDDVVAIELRAIAGATYPLVATYTPDAAVGALDQGIQPPLFNSPLLPAFPYLGVPYSGYDVPKAPTA